jgi:phosphonate transport system ATP-binding protein
VSRGTETGGAKGGGGAAAVADGAALAVRDLVKTFRDGTVRVLDGVSLAIAHGERVALVGANGCGKSTLLRCALRLIEPDSGTVALDGRDLTALRGRELRRARAGVGFVFQKHNLVPRLSVLTNVVHGALARGLSLRAWRQSFAPAHERALALECLALVGLSHLAARRAGELSGGQSQRVAVARALMQQPSLILADEPVASLDPVAGEEVMELFTRLCREQGITLLFVSHHLEHALRYADRLVAMQKGRIERDVPTSSTNAEELRSLYG